MLQTKVVEKSKHTFYQQLFPKIAPFMCGIIWYSGAGNRRQYNTPHAHCVLEN